MPVLYALVLIALAGIVLGSLGYLSLLLVAAASSGRKARCSGGEAATSLGMTVLVPAHNEELVLAATLRSLREQTYPAERYEVVVVADNCTDATAEIARGFGVTVLERHDLRERGKGYALNWALGQLLRRPEAPAAFVVVDADTWVHPEFLRTMGRQLAARSDARGFCALQGRYGVLNEQESWRTALMAGALALCNHVRPLGADRLGWSVGLKGNGMAFTRPVVEAVQWRGDSLTEDLDYGLDLLRTAGMSVGYVPEALVLAQMPVTASQAASQRERWEGGRYHSLRGRAVSLLGEGIARRDFRLWDSALNLVVPPLAELAALLLAWGVVLVIGQIAGWLPDSRPWYGALGGSALLMALYVLGGFYLAGASSTAFRALFFAPIYALWKFILYGGMLLRRVGRSGSGGPEWVRTARAVIVVRDEAEAAPGAAVETT